MTQNILHDVLDLFKASHPEVLEGIDKYIYLMKD